MKKINKGGITYGRSHAEGGIPVKNQSTGEMLEVEGGEGIINKKAMASPQMVKIDGKEMTICEAASYLNQKDGNGRQFNCDDVEHQQFITDHYGVGGELKKGIATEKEHSKTLKKLYYKKITPKAAIREVAKEHIKENPKYYSNLQKMEGKMAKGGTVMNNQDAENAIFDATVFEHGGTVNAYDAGLHKKMYMLGIEVMQPNPIALAKVMSKENDNFCDHYPKLCAGAEYQREELPQIYDKNYDEFVAYLENLGATVSFENEVEVDSLKPVQNEISLERMARIMARVKDGYYKDLNLLKLPLFVSKDGYILDGHHRWATLFFLSPTNTLDIYRVNLTYKELVNNALNFDDAGTEKFMIGGLVTKQSELDTAKSQTVKFKEGKITFYYDFQDFRFSDVVRLEGSSQALMSSTFKQPLFTMYGSLGIFISALLNKELAFIAEELEKTNSFTRWKVFTEPTVTKEKRSQAIDITLDYMRTAYGVRDWFDDQSTGGNKHYEVFAQLYTLATKNFIIEIIQNLQERDWTYAPLTVNDFTDTVKYRNAAEVYHKNIEKIFTVIEEHLERSRQNKGFDITAVDLNLVTLPNTASSTPTQKFENWRFKTDEELRRDYGDYESQGFWVSRKAYLLGQKIKFSAEGKKYFEDYVFTKKRVSETPLVNTNKFFGITSGDDDDWTVVYEMVTQDPLPTTQSATQLTPPTQPTPTITPLIKPLYYGLENSYYAFYPTANRVKIENRFSYIDWEGVVFYGEIAKKEGLLNYFAESVCVVYNTSRMIEKLSVTQVRDMIENNTPSIAMQELFSNKYYFSPLYFDFYTNLYASLEDSVINSSSTGRPLSKNALLQSLIDVSHITAQLCSVNKEELGFAGLGNFKETSSGDVFYPDIITTQFQKNQKLAYTSPSKNIVNSQLSTYVEGLTFQNDDWYDTILQKNTVPIIATLSDSFYEYQDLTSVKTDMMYVPNNVSKLFDYTLTEGGFERRNDFIFWDFTRPLLPLNFFILADYYVVLANFYSEGYIDAIQYEDLKYIGRILQIGSDDKNGRFLEKIQDLPYLKQGGVIRRMEGWNDLTTSQQSLFEKFMGLYKTVVVDKAREQMTRIFEETTTGVMQRSGVGYMPTSTQTQPITAPTQPAPAPTQQPQTRTREVYYNELLYNGVLKKTEKIVGARFLTKKEIAEREKEYEIDPVSFGIINIAQDFISGSQKDAKEYADVHNSWYKDLFGEKLDDNLLPMVAELFAFQKSLDVKISKELFRNSFLQDNAEIQQTRLRFGCSNFDVNNPTRKLFPKVTDRIYLEIYYFTDIQKNNFPDWYKSVIQQIYQGRYASSYRMEFDKMQIGHDIINPYYFFTGKLLTQYIDTSTGYLELPTSYLMLEIEDTSAPVKTQVTATSNPESIKKLKEEYSALQYYLNVEVPIDAFAQRKLISSVMADISNKLEQQIEALYYAPSFEPLFELWADKQTQAQRTINLQPCMLPTPNGEKSELDLVQYEIVRTEEFKKWFGDWEEAAVTGNYNGVSKAINPLTKEPQVVFHGKANMLLEFTKMGFATFPIKYFGTNLSYAEWFRENQSNSNTLIKLVYEFFLDIKNPIDLSPIGLTELTAEDLKEVIKAKYNYQIQSPIVSEGSGTKLKLWQLIRGSSDMLQELKTNTYFDGIIMYEDNPSDTTSLGYESNLLGFSPNSYDIVQKVAGNPQGNFTLDYVTFTNFQIKAADGRNKTFFNKVEDFRFAKGGITKKRKK